MNAFLSLNRNKFFFFFTRTAMIFLAIVCLFLSLGYLFAAGLPDRNLLIYILLGAGLALPVLILLVGGLVEMLYHNSKKKIFSTVPFNHLESLGFYTSYINVHSKWLFIEEVREGRINGFTLVVNISKEKTHIVEIKALVEWKQVDKAGYKRLTQKFKSANIEFGVECLVKYYNTNRPTIRTATDLKSSLEDFTALLKEEGFKPRIGQGLNLTN